MLGNTKQNILLIETQRLKICETAGRLEELEAIFTDENTMYYYPQFLSNVAIGVKDFLDLLNNSGLYVFPFILKATGKVIGFITLNNVEETCKRIEVGYFLISSCWKRGYTREIVDAVITVLKNQEWHRIEATVYSGNDASIKVLEACGFTLEGVLRDKYLIHGKYHDDIIYSIITKDIT